MLRDVMDRQENLIEQIQQCRRLLAGCSDAVTITRLGRFVVELEAKLAAQQRAPHGPVAS
jgi:predicted RecB family endonuclease